MLRNVNALVTDLRNGQPLNDPGAADGTSMTVASALLNALLSVNVMENPQPSAKEKKARYDLAIRISASAASLNQLIDFSDKELDLIKTVADLYGTMVYGALIIWADTDIPTPSDVMNCQVQTASVPVESV